METKVYKKGVNVVVERSDFNSHYIPTRSARLQPHNDTLQVTDQETGWSVHIPFTDLRDEQGGTFASVDLSLDYLSEFVGSFNLDGQSGQNPSEALFSTTADNYNALIVNDGENVGDLAYAFNEQGTKWLPGGLGGTYYPQGVYVWDGFNWVSDRTAISEQLQLNIDALDDKVDRGFLGWVQLSDSQYDTVTRFPITSGVRTKLPNNANGVLDVTSMFGATTIYDPATEKLTPDNFGDTYDWRVSFFADPTLNNRNFTLELDIGGSQGVIWSKTIRLARGAGVDTKITETLDIYTLNTFIANGGELYVTCDGDVSLYDIIYKIERKYRHA